VIAFPRWARDVMVIALIADMLMFSRATTLSLMGMVMGAALVLIGLTYAYRVASFLGLLVVSAVAGASIEIPTLTELSGLFTAMLSLLLPIFGLAWLSLTVEERERHEVTLMRKPLATAITFSILALWSAPLTILVMSLFIPTISTRLSVISEAAIMLIATIVGVVILTRRNPAPPKATSEEVGEWG